VGERRQLLSPPGSHRGKERGEQCTLGFRASAKRKEKERQTRSGLTASHERSEGDLPSTLREKKSLFSTTCFVQEGCRRIARVLSARLHRGRRSHLSALELERATEREESKLLCFLSNDIMWRRDAPLPSSAPGRDFLPWSVRGGGGAHRQKKQGGEGNEWFAPVKERGGKGEKRENHRSLDRRKKKETYHLPNRPNGMKRGKERGRGGGSMLPLRKMRGGGRIGDSISTLARPSGEGGKSRLLRYPSCKTGEKKATSSAAALTKKRERKGEKGIRRRFACRPRPIKRERRVHALSLSVPFSLGKEERGEEVKNGHSHHSRWDRDCKSGRGITARCDAATGRTRKKREKENKRTGGHPFGNKKGGSSCPSFITGNRTAKEKKRRKKEERRDRIEYAVGRRRPHRRGLMEKGEDTKDNDPHAFVGGPCGAREKRKRKKNTRGPGQGPLAHPERRSRGIWKRGLTSQLLLHFI